MPDVQLPAPDTLRALLRALESIRAALASYDNQCAGLVCAATWPHTAHVRLRDCVLKAAELFPQEDHAVFNKAPQMLTGWANASTLRDSLFCAWTAINGFWLAVGSYTVKPGKEWSQRWPIIPDRDSRSLDDAIRGIRDTVSESSDGDRLAARAPIPPKRGGRPKRSAEERKKDAALVARWKQAHERRVLKAEFVADEGILVDDLDKALDREYQRNRAPKKPAPKVPKKFGKKNF